MKSDRYRNDTETALDICGGAIPKTIPEYE